MTREICIKSSIIIYEEFYRQITLDQSYVLPIKNRKLLRLALDKHVDWIKEHFATDQLKDGLLRVGYEWLVEYFKFQFDYWIWRIDNGKEYYQYGYKSIKFNWVVGQEARKKFLKQEDTIYKHKHTRSINKAEVTMLHKLKEYSPENLKALKEVFLHDKSTSERERFYNTNEGLINCLAQTTLYNPDLGICLRCNNRMLCRDLLKENYPKLYKNRIENGV